MLTFTPTGFVKAMKECDVHRQLLEEMQNDEPMSDGEVHSDGVDEVCNEISRQPFSKLSNAKLS